MKHRISGRKLGRDKQGRSALFRSLAASLIRSGAITTTQGRAKALRPIVEKLVTKARSGGIEAGRQVHSFLQDSRLTKKLVDELVPRLPQSSGFVRLVKTTLRRGDAAKMIRIEWVKTADPDSRQPQTEETSKK